MTSLSLTTSSPLVCQTFHDRAVFTLNDHQPKSMLAVIDRLDARDPYHLTMERIVEAKVAFLSLPEELLEAIIKFKHIGDECGTFLIRNLPLDAMLPDTPADGRPSALKKSRVSEHVLLACMLQLGSPISYIDEKEGHLIQNICPVEGQESQQENTGSVFLEFHSENGFHPYKPDFLSLLCLRSDHEGKAITLTSSIRRALPHLPSSAVEILRRPFFQITHSPSFSHFHDGATTSAAIPILKGSLFDPELCVDYQLMRPLNSQAKWAMDLLGDVLTQQACGAVLQPGDLLIVDNRRAIHARTAFTPQYDGRDRWLQRMFVVEDLRRSQWARATNSLVCTPLDSLITMAAGELHAGSSHAQLLGAPR